MSDRDWRGEMDAAENKNDRAVQQIHIYYNRKSAIHRAMELKAGGYGDVNQAMEAVRDMLVQCKAAGIDPLSLFRKRLPDAPREGP